MTLDDNIRSIMLEVAGSNVLRQMELVVPDFFDGKYIVTRMASCTQQPEQGMSVTLEPEVILSTHREYTVGQRAANHRELTKLTGEGYFVGFHPLFIRGCAGGVNQEILEEGPYDSLVIAQLNDRVKGRKGLGKLHAFYRNTAYLFGGITVRSIVKEKEFCEGLGRCNIHFVFVPPGEKRVNCYIERHGWALKRVRDR